MKKKLQHFSQSFNGDFYFDDLHKTLYATDASVYRMIPLAVAYPRSNDCIKQLIKFAAQNKTSLIPRTAGTSLAGQCVGEGIVVDVSRYFTQIIDLDIANRTVTVQPGVVRDELNAYLKPHGLFFGPNTSTSNRCMIGGMVGNNSSGTTSIQYGVTRDKVLEIQTILADGSEASFQSITSEILQNKLTLPGIEGAIYRFFHQELSKQIVRDEIIKQYPKPEIHRRNTGYAVDLLLDAIEYGGNQPLNLAHILCGSEGTLAFTTQVTLALDPLPPVHTAMVATHYNDLQSCLNDVQTAMKHNLHTCEMVDDTILDCTKTNKKYEPYRSFVVGDPKAILLLEVKSDTKKDLQSQIDALLVALNETTNSYAQPVLYGEATNNALELRKAGLGLLGNIVGDKKAVACIEDTAVALEDLSAYIKEFTALMERSNQQAVYYAHAGAGELHLRPILNLKSSEDVAHFREITTAVAQLVKKYNGSFSGEHGDGIVRAEFIELMIGEKNYQLIKEIKKAFDPNNIFNPGKIVDPWPMDASLRYDIDRDEPNVETLLDFDDSQGILRLAESCNGSGDCRKSAAAGGTMCPSYQATKNEKDTTRARANVLREVLTTNDAINAFDSTQLKEVFDLCISCKACGSECPSNVDMATAKAEFLYQYKKSNGATFSQKLLGKSSYYNKKAARFSALSNGLFSNKFTSGIIKRTTGIDKRRTIPSTSSKSFDKRIKNVKNQIDKSFDKVYLFVDEFSNYLEADIAMDAFELLTGLGFNVECITHLDSARALISKGFLEEAKIEIDKSIAFLKDKITKDTPLIGIEPSAILGFRDEYVRLATNPENAREIAPHCLLIEEFLAVKISEEKINASQFTSEVCDIKIHNHCHQKALSNQKVTFDVLNLPVNYKPTIITSGCCGMAGSFGYEKTHYEVSMQIGELKLFPAIRKAKSTTIIAANGTSCRHQIKDGTQAKALHPITILNRALLSHQSQN